MSSAKPSDCAVAPGAPILAGGHGAVVARELERRAWSGSRLPPTLQSSPEQVAQAVASAREGFDAGAWRGLSRLRRREVLLRWASLIEEHAPRLARINCLETGRSLRSLQRDSLPKAVAALRWFAELVDKLADRSLHPGEFGTDFAIVRHEPIGVVAAILPWNDPLVTFAWKVAPALGMGNAVIVKPSEHATLVLREAVLLAHQAGVPVHSLQLLSGDGYVGRELVAQPDVAKIAFTGSSATAAAIGREAHRHGLKRLSFECGGKGAFVFGLAGRDIAEFAAVVATNMYYNQGQICSAPSVVHVPSSRVDEFMHHLSLHARTYLPGDPLGAREVGCMVSREAVARVRAALDPLPDSMFAGPLGDRTTPADDPAWSITPSLLCGLPDEHVLWDTELFAPVLLLRPYDDIASAIAHANASRYGLAAGIWSQDMDECVDVAARLRVGIVHINSWGDDPNQVPFGGVKQSGHGHEKALETIESYAQLKSVYYRPRRGA